MVYMGFATSVIIDNQFEHLDEYINPFTDFMLVFYARCWGSSSAEGLSVI